MSRIVSVGTAVPEHVLTQEEAKALARRIFAGVPGLEQRLEVFDRAGVRRRHFAFPPDYYGRTAGFRRRNEDYLERAVDLAIRACEEAGVVPSEVDHVVFVTTTGLSTPSLDAHLAHRIGLRPDVKRTPIYGVGCAGGAVGLARAFDFSRADPEATILLVSVELCGQTFDPRDHSSLNMVAAALFGDGAAAVLVGPGPGPLIEDTASRLLPASLDVMGWDFTDRGPRLVLTREIPGLVRRHVGAAVGEFLGRNGLSLADLNHFLIHPGGPRVLDAIHGGLGLVNEALKASRTFLGRYGNLSSASVLFILKEALPGIEPGHAALILAVGPGFSLDQVLLLGDGRPPRSNSHP